MTLFAAGISYKTAPVEVREKVAVPASKITSAAAHVKELAGLAELVLVSTCNRVEMYGATEHPEQLERLFEFLAEDGARVAPYVYLHTGSEAARHLFSVASGLDSMVLGETEITGQIKQAYETAQAAGLTGRFTNCLFQKALQTAKAIRTETQIGQGATSVGSVAVQLADKIFGSTFHDKTVMIIGAGKMGEAVVKHLAKKGVKSVIVANRSIEKAQALADAFGGRAVNYMDDGLTFMQEADIVVSSTDCPHTILDREDVAFVMSHRLERPLFLVDIAVPRDIAPDARDVKNVFLYDIDDMEAVVRENVRQREHELGGCREIVSRYVGELMSKLQNDGASRVPRAASNRRVTAETETLAPVHA
jgi:glutamyl-tRNA reductase